jgi:4-diphosphocytidyl-2-C-methyl-D-erythritol kinase
MDNIVVESPAKINLGLNVVKKRVDGYHDLETIFLPLMLSDKLTFKRSDRLAFNTNNSSLNEIKENLILQAIKILEVKSGKEFMLDIFVEKNIPIGGGLGGGSSNAAATLKAVNKLFDLDLNYMVLSDLALELGSDVPYFLNPVPCYAESRGEILYPLDIEFSYPILIVNPGIKIETASAFKKITPIPPKKKLSEILNYGVIDLDLLNDFVRNDFEEVVFNEYPDLKKIKADLYREGAQFALMSGTGSTIYGIFTNLQRAIWAEEYFKQKYYTFLHHPFNKGSIT